MTENSTFSCSGTSQKRIHSNNLLQKRPPNTVQLTATAYRAGNDALDSKVCIKSAISFQLSISFLRPKLFDSFIGWLLLMFRIVRDVQKE